jgi:hypothetical protein
MSAFFLWSSTEFLDDMRSAGFDVALLDVKGVLKKFLPMRDKVSSIHLLLEVNSPYQPPFLF